MPVRLYVFRLILPFALAAANVSQAAAFTAEVASG